MRNNLLTISYPDNGETMDIKTELTKIRRKYGISKSRFVYEATKKEIDRINMKAPLI
jgi:hypothetical protein